MAGSSSYKWLIVLLAVVVGLWLLFRMFFGGIGELAVENMIEEAARQNGENVDVNFDMDGSFDVTTDEGTVNWGAGLSADWPEDVPVYPGAEVTFSAVANNLADGGLGGYATFSTTDSASEVVDFYVEEMTSKGWAVRGNVSFDSSVTASFEKEELAMSVTAVEVEGQTTITIGFGK